MSEMTKSSHDSRKEKAIWNKLNSIILENRSVFEKCYKYGDGEGGYILHKIKELCDIKEHNQLPEKPKRKSISGKVRREVMEDYAYRCAICSSYKNLQIDHIIPVCIGGGNSKENLQVLCESCNLLKGSSTEDLV